MSETIGFEPIPLTRSNRHIHSIFHIKEPKLENAILHRC
jgi:hypothetical protein